MLKKVDKLITENHYYCDVCEKVAPNPKKCCGCNKDLCQECSNPHYHDIFNDCDLGDYPDFYCNNCEKELDKVKEAVKIVHYNHECEINKLVKEFKRNCKNAPNNAK